MAKRPRIGDVIQVRMGPDEYRDFVLGPDIDLDKEVILDDRGERINDAWIEREVEKMRHLPSSVGGSQEMTTTPTETNRTIIRHAFEAWQQGTGVIADVLAPDMVWRIEGHSLASRQYASKQAFIDEVLAPFGARFARGEPFRPVRIRAVLSDGDTVTVIWDGRGVANDGQPYENSYAWIMQMRDGLVTDGTAFYDSISFNALWTRVQPA